MNRPVFGVDRDPGVLARYSTTPRPFPKVNPMLVFGAGPEGAKCRTCVHLVKVNVDTSHGGFLKCEVRGITSGTGTDHRAKWDACARYEARA